MPRVGVKTYAWRALNLFVRVISICIMDAILKSPYSVTIDCTAWLYRCATFIVDSVLYRSDNTDNYSLTKGDSSLMYGAFVVLHMIGFFIATLSLIYPTRLLLSAYLSASCGILIFWSYVMNVEYIKYCLDLIIQGTSVMQELFSLNKMTLFMFFVNYLSQSFCAILFCFSFLISPRSQKVIYGFHFIFPTLLSSIAVPDYLLLKTPLFTAIMEVSIIVYYFLTRRTRICLRFVRPFLRAVYIANQIGWFRFFSFVIKDINMWAAFAAFWVFRTTKQAVLLLYETALLHFKEKGVFALTGDSVKVVLKQLVIQSCDTFLAVMGVTCILATVLVYAVKFFRILFSLPTPPHHERNLRPMISFVFITLAIQTGLTGLEPSERLLRLYRNLMLIFPAVALSIYEDVDSTLMRLSISGNNSVSKHVKALIGAFSLISYSLSMLIFLVSMHNFSAWLLASFAFNLDLAVKVVLSIISYCLYVVDMWHNGIWEGLDNYVFFITTFGQISNFFFNVFLLFNACYILIYESVGVTRILLMMIHMYFNIWFQMKAGWIKYRKHIAAATITRSLSQATEEQLNKLDDICSICCYQLKTARVTKCNHFFHETCLRKWLVQRDTCPICHKSCFAETSEIASRIELAHEHQE